MEVEKLVVVVKDGRRGSRVERGALMATARYQVTAQHKTGSAIGRQQLMLENKEEKNSHIVKER